MLINFEPWWIQYSIDLQTIHSRTNVSKQNNNWLYSPIDQTNLTTRWCSRNRRTRGLSYGRVWSRVDSLPGSVHGESRHGLVDWRPMDVAQRNHIAEYHEGVQPEIDRLLAQRCVPVSWGDPTEYGRNWCSFRRPAVHDKGTGAADSRWSTHRFQARLEAGDDLHGRQWHLLVHMHNEWSREVARTASWASHSLVALSARQYATNVCECSARAAGGDRRSALR